MDHVDISGVRTSRFIIGSNPFSGFSHQGSEMDSQMKRFYTTDKIKETLHDAESLGVTTVIARTDYHVIRMLFEYGNEGGQIQWFAQTCPEVGDHQMCVARAAAGGAKACHVHGGVMDFLLAQGRLDEIPPLIKMIRDKGMRAGIAGHNPAVFEWAENHLDVDYYMCCYYNSAHRDTRAEHVPGMAEWFLEEDRRTMTDLIAGLSKPVIHYKVLAAGRNDPQEAFDWVAKSMRASDAVCVGVYMKDKPDMLKTDVQLFHASLQARAE